jgi:cell division protein FtsI/penicillin-binding protein 2
MLGWVSAIHTQRRWLAAITLLVVLSLAGCGGSSSTPQATLNSFLSAWHRHDFAAMRRQVLDPPSDFEAVNATALSDLGVSAPQLSAGSVQQSGSHATAAVVERFALPAAGEWTTRTTVRLTDHKGHWLIAWTPATINAALHTGGQIALIRHWATRAAILGAAGAPLTTQRPLVMVGVVGGRIKNAHAVSADLLAAGASQTQVSQALAQAKAHPSYFEPVFEVSKAHFEQLKSQPGPGNVYAVPGTQFELTSNRRALTPQLGAHAVGAVGPITAEELQRLGPPYDASSAVGQTGIEQAYEHQLAGTPTSRVVAINAGGAPIQTLATFPGHPGKPVITSIDPAVQRAAEAALAGEHRNVAMVAIRASTGHVLAVVSDPVSYAYDQALEGEYPPGSTFKVLTSTALIRAGLSPSSAANCVPTVTVNGEVFHNAEGEQPVQNLSQAFTESCNTAFISLATAHLHPADFTSTSLLYGLRASPQPGLPAFGAVVPRPTGTTSLAATAIGQAGVVFSPLGMASVAAAIDSGTVRQPVLVSGAPGASAAPKLLPANVTSALRPMMADVVTSGTASGTGLPSGTHAKTGTAQYYSGGKLRTDAWLMGYDGDIAFAIVVQNSGGINGGPLDGPLIAKFLNALGSRTRR